MSTLVGTRVPTKSGRAGLAGVESLLARLLLLALLVLAAWLALQPAAVPPVVSITPDAPDAFSAARALHDLEVITAQPRVMGTPGLAQARTYLAAQFEAIGLTPEITDMTSIRQNAGLGAVIAAETHDVIARLPGTASTGAILIGGHLDTVHTTTAASDCGGCSASVLEIARALAAGPPLRNDVIFLIEDGEETTRAGALSFVEQHPWAKDVRVALNQEAMGTGGAAQIYVTGPQNGWLMAEALRAMPSPVAYAYANDLVWLSGTGGSDLDQFLMAAPVGLGLVYLASVPAYHTFRDNVANLDPLTLQHNGDNLLALTRHFGNLPLDGPLAAPDRVYFNLLGHFVVHYPAWAGVGLALLAVLGLLVVITLGLRRSVLTWRGLLVGFVVFVPWVAVATAANGVLWTAIRYLDPRLQLFLIGITYDRELYTVAFVALAGGITLAGYALLRRCALLDLSAGALIWWVMLAALTAFTLPGSSPLFALPALLVLLATGAAVWRPQDKPGIAAWALLALAGVGTILVLAPALNFLGIFSGRAELIMNLPMIALLPAPLAAMAAALLLPLWHEMGGGRRWIIPAAALAVATAILVWVGFTAGFSKDRPRPNMVAYTLEDGAAHWVTLGAKVADRRDALLDDWTGQFFASEVEATLDTPWGAAYMEPVHPAYRAPAPVVDLPLPTLEVLSDQPGDGGLRRLDVRIHAGGDAPLRGLRIESEDPIEQLTLLGKPMDEVASAGSPRQILWVELYGFSGQSIDLGLAVRGDAPVRVRVDERSYSLPDIPGLDIQPRPAWMMPSPTFVTDSTLVRHTLVID